MAERQINIKVENLVPILQEGCDEIVCGNGTYTVLFDFDEEWTGLNTKTAIFVCGDTPLYSVFEGNICKVPEIDGGTVCYIGVVSGSIEDINAKADKRTTVWCSVKAKPSITSIAKEPKAPSQDVYVEFMALLNKYVTGGGGGGTVEFIVDQHYFPQSARAQSGKAVTEAILPIKNDLAKVDLKVKENAENVSQLSKISEEFEDVKVTVNNQGTSLEVAVTSAVEAKNKVDALGGVVQTLVKDANESRDLLWQETQRATKAETDLEKSKQDKLAFDGAYNEQSNRVATMESVAREVARIVANAPSDFDTLKELADWLQNHSADATQMNSRISANATAITQINTEQSAQNTKIEQNKQRIDNAFTSANNSLNIANTSLVYSSEAKQISENASAKVDRLEQNMQDIVVFDGDYNPETNKAATVSTVSNEVAKIVASAPEDFDTLKEIADYIASDKTGATQINNTLSQHGTKISENETAISELGDEINALQQDIGSSLDELHNYAQNLVSGGAIE